ncbi:hypothetical protein ANAEL_03621 [Anaerolineales bacterium]|nr:hypothetical protein ANAEL_03621 [Anaerolineales bacterium]
MIKRFLMPILLFAVFFAGMSAIQFATPDMPDNDGFYHIKLAWLMRTESLKPAFPYLPLSILNENEFYDHHFLFHVALIPFTFGDLRLGAKWAAVTFSALAFLSVWYLFHRQKIPLAWLWAIGLLGISDAFLYRMSITRAQSLSLAVLVLGLTWILEGRYKHLAVLSFFYVWMYDAFPLILAIAGLHFLSILLLENRLEFRPLLWAGIGIGLGLIINPYFPDNLIFTWHHLLPKLQDATSVSVGNEWYPYDTAQVLRNSSLALIAFASGTLALGLSGRKIDLRTTLSFLLALLFAVMLFKARRFVEYFPPFALIFSAFAWAPLFNVERQPVLAESKLYGKLQTSLPVILLAVAVSAGIVKSIPVAQERIIDSKPYTLYEGASNWLVKNTPSGELVFQTDWDDFQRLFFYNTHNTYLAGLDPTYLQLYDGDLYDLWVDITRGRVEQPSKIILERFSARYVHTDLKHGNFLREAADDPGLIEVYRDEQAVIFQVAEP